MTAPTSTAFVVVSIWRCLVVFEAARDGLAQPLSSDAFRATRHRRTMCFARPGREIQTRLGQERRWFSYDVFMMRPSRPEPVTLAGTVLFGHDFAGRGGISTSFEVAGVGALSSDAAGDAPQPHHRKRTGSPAWPMQFNGVAS
jgi:hypothetical protein